jgi:hypothetical protein
VKDFIEQLNGVIAFSYETERVDLSAAKSPWQLSTTASPKPAAAPTVTEIEATPPPPAPPKPV